MGRSAFGHVFLLRSGRTRVTPMVDTCGQSLPETEPVNGRMEASLYVLGYPPVDLGSEPLQMQAALKTAETQSNDDRAAVLRLSPGLNLTG